MIHIDQAGPDDIPQMVDLLELLFAQEADFAPDRARQEQGLRLIIESPATGVIFVAREDDQVVGMVSLLFTVSTAQGSRVCWLEDMVVKPNRRECGLGSRLDAHHTVDRAIQYAGRPAL